MEPIVNYLEDTEKKLVKEMSKLFCKMREQRDTMSLQGIETMYTYKPVEGVLYEPCIRIPLTLGPRTGHYYWNNFTLPKDEYVIFIKENKIQVPWSPPTSYSCTILTNYGRCFTTKQVKEECLYQQNCFSNYSGSYSSNDNIPIIKLDPLPYKLPTHFFKIFLLAFNIGHANTIPTGGTAVDITTSLQELNKEFYLFAGKWQPHMTVYATIEVDTMRKTILENTENIQELSQNNELLEEQNRNLQAELEKLKEQNAALEKEKTKLLPLEKYKEAVIDYMNNHYDTNKQWLSQDIEYEDEDDGNEIPMDSSIIDLFKAFHSNKVFMEQYEYDDFMNQQEELNEYRIYKKVKGRK